MTDNELKYQFAPARLKDLDALTGDLLVVSMFEEDRPPQGLAGLVDWRMDGLISRLRLKAVSPALPNPHFHGLVMRPFAARELEKLLFPPGRKLPFSAVLVLGLGARTRYDANRYRAAVKEIISSLSLMRTRSVTLELPAWERCALPARRACDAFAADWFAMRGQGIPVPSEVCFIEKLEHQAEMDERIVEIARSQPRRR
jgi:hypothetical protein